LTDDKSNQKSGPGRPPQFAREEVLEAILQAFWRHGFDAISIGNLEAATGLKRASLYSAFGNKSALFEATLNHYLATRMQPTLERISRLEPAVALREMVLFWNQFMKEQEGLGCFATATSTWIEPEISVARSNEALLGLRGQILEWFQSHLPETAAQNAADGYLASVLGLHHIARSRLGNAVLDRATQAALKNLERELAS
jgi:AcrR family transcriptional regulator